MYDFDIYILKKWVLLLFRKLIDFLEIIQGDGINIDDLNRVNVRKIQADELTMRINLNNTALWYGIEFAPNHLSNI